MVLRVEYFKTFFMGIFRFLLSLLDLTAPVPFVLFFILLGNEGHFLLEPAES